jgi:hypothetical protein
LWRLSPPVYVSANSKGNYIPVIQSVKDELQLRSVEFMMQRMNTGGGVGLAALSSVTA